MIKQKYLNTIEKVFGDISLITKPTINDNKYESVLSRSTIRRVFNILKYSNLNQEGYTKVFRAIIELGEHTQDDDS
ncbi:unnamed protein product [Adineta steineri]|uniref:Uncharacterized protein n=1 Tax=Adineta steineri TaxID=433720 RepID=A0A813WT43_9BILA|nr:unnamed protein product [Adineta steineri]CAF4125501.1 unnamed protein product [Adineta steineri]